MIDEVVESDSGSDSDDVSDSSLRPLNMPSYAEFWARLAYELMRLNERADVQAVSAYHASLKAAALSAAQTLESPLVVAAAVVVQPVVSRLIASRTTANSLELLLDCPLGDARVEHAAAAVIGQAFVAQKPGHQEHVVVALV